MTDFFDDGRFGGLLNFQGDSADPELEAIIAALLAQGTPAPESPVVQPTTPQPVGQLTPLGSAGPLFAPLTTATPPLPPAVVGERSPLEALAEQSRLANGEQNPSRPPETGVQPFLDRTPRRTATRATRLDSLVGELRSRFPDPDAELSRSETDERNDLLAEINPFFGRNRFLIGLQEELDFAGGSISVREFNELRERTYEYLIDGGDPALVRTFNRASDVDDAIRQAAEDRKTQAEADEAAFRADRRTLLSDLADPVPDDPLDVLAIGNYYGQLAQSRQPELALDPTVGRLEFYRQAREFGLTEAEIDEILDAQLAADGAQRNSRLIEALQSGELDVPISGGVTPAQPRTLPSVLDNAEQFGESTSSLAEQVARDTTRRGRFNSLISDQRNETISTQAQIRDLEREQVIASLNDYTVETQAAVDELIARRIIDRQLEDGSEPGDFRSVQAEIEQELVAPSRERFGLLSQALGGTIEQQTGARYAAQVLTGGLDATEAIRFLNEDRAAALNPTDGSFLSSDQRKTIEDQFETSIAVFTEITGARVSDGGLVSVDRESPFLIEALTDSQLDLLERELAALNLTTRGVRLSPRPIRAGDS